MPIGCLLIPQFPAWVLARPLPPQQAVLVTNGRTLCAFSPSLARRGLVVGMSADRAHSLAPAACMLARDPDLEAVVWDSLVERLLAVTPRLEAPRLGLALLGDPPLDALRAVSAPWRAQGALAPCRSFAFLGALRAARGSVLHITPPGVRGFLQHYPVRELTDAGITDNVVELLTLYGLVSLGEVARLTRRHLSLQFGPAGMQLYDWLHPDDEPPVPLFSPPATVRQQRDLDPPCSVSALAPVIENLVCEAAVLLGDRLAQRVDLIIDEVDRRARRASRFLPLATNEPRALSYAARRAAERLITSDYEFDRVTVTLGALRTAPGDQTHLFKERPPVSRAIEQVLRRYPGTLLQIRSDPHALFPDERARCEPIPAPAVGCPLLH